MKRVVYCSKGGASAQDKVREIEDVLGIKLKGGVYDLEDFKREWNAFYRNPSQYANSAVVDMVKQWYSEIYPDKGFVDAYYMEPRVPPSLHRSNPGVI